MQRDMGYEQQRRASKHIHKYARVVMNGSLYWRCADPLCSHYMPKKQEALIEGRASICHECGGVMIMEGEALTMNKPICPDCQNKENTDAFDRYLTERGDIIDRTTK